MADQIRYCFPYQPTDEQERAINLLSEFLLSTERDSVFLLTGYAGTGKTILVSSFVKAMDKFKKKSLLLAPTGRAAKVFSLYSNHTACTIHKCIYRQKTFSADIDNFSINVNLMKDTIFIVDEASMISNSGLSGHTFGSGRLLDDLMQFVYSGEGCRLILMGDTAQLPPIGEDESPALTVAELQAYGMKVYASNLIHVVRQKIQSGILWNASNIRKKIEEDIYDLLPKVRLSGFNDICRLNGDELIDTLSSCYDKDGLDDTVVICRSNKRANLYNNGIRAQILYREDELESGDVLMIAKNNYYWTDRNKDMDFIANGENAVVRRVHHIRELYGFRFASVLLSFPNYDGVEIEVNLLLDTLHSESPALSESDNERLFTTISEDYADIPHKKDRMEKMKHDPYYNALQVKYAYAVTCHKAQGGQWKNVFLDQAYLSPEYITPDYYRWLYTAFTRATETLYLVNYPPEKTE